MASRRFGFDKSSRTGVAKSSTRSKNYLNSVRNDGSISVGYSSTRSRQLRQLQHRFYQLQEQVLPASGTGSTSFRNRSASFRTNFNNVENSPTPSLRNSSARFTKPPRVSGTAPAAVEIFPTVQFFSVMKYLKGL
jgi:hypothetical protein